MRYGQRVERTNKNIDSMFKTTPQQITATPIPLIDLISFTTFIHKGCGVKVLYPNKLSVITESTNEAKLGLASESPSILLSCNPSKSLLLSLVNRENTIVSTQSAQLAGTGATYYKHKKINGITQISILTRHPQKGTYILLTVDERIIPLVQETLEFISSYGNP